MQRSLANVTRSRVRPRQREARLPKKRLAKAKKVGFLLLWKGMTVAWECRSRSRMFCKIPHRTASNLFRFHLTCQPVITLPSSSSSSSSSTSPTFFFTHHGRIIIIHNKNQPQHPHFSFLADFIFFCRCRWTWFCDISTKWDVHLQVYMHLYLKNAPHVQDLRVGILHTYKVQTQEIGWCNN